MDKNIDYKLKDAYKNLRECVQLLGYELRRNYEYMDEIREIQDVDHDVIENLNSELEKKNELRRHNFNFCIGEIRKRLINVELHYDILEKYFRIREASLQTLSDLQQEDPKEN